jgi:hypothetical protein
MYHATKNVFNKDLSLTVEAAPLPVMHMGADGWTSKISKGKFLGVRVSYVNVAWQLKSHLLAVTLFRPDQQATKGQQLSDVQLTYVKQVSHTRCA